MTQKKPAKITLKTAAKNTKVQKETIHVDINDDITALINSIKKSPHAIVAIVLPKNAHVLQSVVNMKLLKRAAAKSKKNIALISNDPSVLTLAGVAGVHVADTVTSKPYVPTVNIEDVEQEDIEAVVAMDSPGSSDEDDIVAGAESDDTTDKQNIDKIKQKNKKFKIPDFGSFQVKLFASVFGFMILGILWFFGFVVMPEASITVKTNTQTVPIKEKVTLDFDEAAVVDNEAKTLPAIKVTTEKTSESLEQATGEKNVGEKAKGSITLSAKVCGAISTPSSVPKGTGVSANGNTYITQDEASFSFNSFDGSCLNFMGSTVDIVAQDSGEAFNTPNNTTFTVAGRSNVSATGDATGGTTSLVTIISEEDVENAKASLGDAARGEALQELRQKLLSEGFTAMDITLKANEPKYSVSPAVGEEAASVTVKQTVVYELSGYRQADLEEIVNATLQATLSEQQESKNVSDNGADSVTFAASGSEEFELTTVATIGPSLDIESLKEEFVGAKRGEIIDRLESIEGVTSAEVTYNPMWITTTPKSAKKILIEVQTQ